MAIMSMLGAIIRSGFFNSFRFYLSGWKGITIDADDDFINLHKKIHPKDINLHCAVSDSEREVTFTKFQ
jgi:hypothetical protein